jgi:hypothetical protein
VSAPLDPSTADLAAPCKLKELQRVLLVRPCLVEGRNLPEGARGTIVLSYRDGQAFEVEFTEPNHVVVGVAADLLSPLAE